MSLDVPAPFPFTASNNDDKASNIRSTDFGLDPSDPLNLLLHDTSRSETMLLDDVSSSSQGGGSPPDWSELSQLWSNVSENDMKYPDLALDFDQFDLSVPMNIDFNPSIAVAPSSLHFDSKPGTQQQSYGGIVSYPETVANDFFPGSFPFTFSSPDPSISSNDNASFKPRRLSSASSSSSSGASLSPIIEQALQPSPSQASPADELAERVRQSAGVMLAVPAGAHAQQPLPAERSTTQGKLPIPRLPRTKLPFRSRQSSTKASDTRPDSLPSSNAGTPPPSDGSVEAGTGASISVIGRPKTSHTTIERRYRTNLNARIQSLRQAVPALRVLEEKDKSAEDIVDERGFVDGVKVARKGSKANVLGKAVEYIRVLKKREARLKREQSGLKSLLCGLVGGPALLKEWEREWRENFGGEEKDEIEGDEAEPASDDDEGEVDEEGDDDDGRAKKRARVVKAPKKKPTPAPTVDSQNVVPEKRKRGRPRKNPIATEVPTSLPDAIQSQAQGQGQPAQQYLLATFALFSFFNSPLTSPPSSHHTHSGRVLTQAPTPAVPEPTYGWYTFVQAFHLLVSALVFFSIVVPWLPVALKRTRLLRPLSSLVALATAPSSTHASPAGNKIQKRKKSDTDAPLDPYNRGALVDALSPACRGSADEAYALRYALGVSSGAIGLVQAVLAGGRRGHVSFEQRQLEQRCWVRLGELVAMDPMVSTATRLQTYWCMRTHVSWFRASTADLATLALIIRPLAPTKAAQLWARARRTELVRPFERLVLEGFKVGDAAVRLPLTGPGRDGPLGVLAAGLVQERVHAHAAALFTRTVLPGHGMEKEDAEEDKRREQTVEAGRALGGQSKELVDALERVWATGDLTSEDEEDGEEGEIRALLLATVLYRRIFPTAITGAGTDDVAFVLSPPPSPSPPDVLALRRSLGSSAFDAVRDDESAGVSLEDVRDRVVDMLVDLERSARSRSAA